MLQRDKRVHIANVATFQRVLTTDVVTLGPTSRSYREVSKIGVANIMTFQRLEFSRLLQLRDVETSRCDNVVKLRANVAT